MQSWRTWPNCSLCCSRENHCGVWFVLCCSIIWLSKTWLVGISKGRPFACCPWGWLACSEWVLRLSIADTSDQTEGCLRSVAMEAPFIGRNGGAQLIPANPERFVLNLLNNSTHLFSRRVHERHLSMYSDSYLSNWLPNIQGSPQDRSNLPLITSWRMLHKFLSYLLFI